MIGHSRIRLWAVIGGTQAGKSTTIGHLAYSVPVTTGIHLAAGFRQVLLRGGGRMRVYAIPQALQEHNRRTPEETVTLALEIIASQIQDEPTACLNLLIALRLRPVSSGGVVYPAGHEYIAHFVRNGWQLESLALLSPSNADEITYQHFGAPLLRYDTNAPENREINLMVGMVRNHFGWA